MRAWLPCLPAAAAEEGGEGGLGGARSAAGVRPGGGLVDAPLMDEE